MLPEPSDVLVSKWDSFRNDIARLIVNFVLRNIATRRYARNIELSIRQGIYYANIVDDPPYLRRKDEPRMDDIEDHFEDYKVPTVGDGLLDDVAADLYGHFADLSEGTLSPKLCADLANFAAGYYVGLQGEVSNG